MKIIILGGFLGSGKTTVLLKLAEYLTKNNHSHKEYPVIILENEAGAEGVDSVLLKAYPVTKLFAGCLCCTLAGEMAYKIKHLEETYAPEWLIIEASGVAFPGSIRKSIRQMTNAPIYTIVIADANRWNRIIRPLEHLLRPQIESGDMILINKLDMLNKEAVIKIEENIHKINPLAKIYKICGLKDISPDIWNNLCEIEFQEE